MDLIYTNSNRVDQGVLHAYSMDLSYGAEENDFELTVSQSEAVLQTGAVVYCEGTEYGGIIDGMKTSSNAETITYYGRTWHGILNSKVLLPIEGEDYLEASGTGFMLLTLLVARMGLNELFNVTRGEYISINLYRFARYCKGYDGFVDMLASGGAKLKIEWKDRKVQLSAVPIVDYTNYPVDSDMAVLTVERYDNKVNHLICLGRGELAEREVIDLYVDQFGRIGDVKYYTGAQEYVDVYDNSNAESYDELRSEGVKRLKELRDCDTSEIAIIDNPNLIYDIGDIVGATEIRSGIKVSATVTQKIVRIKNGVANIEYKTGG